jgi:hypothetical protein
VIAFDGTLAELTDPAELQPVAEKVKIEIAVIVRKAELLNFINSFPV